jgi:hypothetical protein
VFGVVIEEECLVPLRVGSFKTSGFSGDFLEPQFHEGIGPVELQMFIAVVNLVIPLTLVLEGSEEGVSVHVDARLLPIKALAIPSEPIIHHVGQIHHLLLLEFNLFVLKVFDPFERCFPDGHIPSRPDVHVNLQLIKLRLCVTSFVRLGPELSLLSEQILEEDC